MALEGTDLLVVQKQTGNNEMRSLTVSPFQLSFQTNSRLALKALLMPRMLVSSLILQASKMVSYISTMLLLLATLLGLQVLIPLLALFIQTPVLFGRVLQVGL